MRKIEKTSNGYCHVIIKDRITGFVIYEGVVSYNYRATLVNDTDFIVITIA